MGHLNLSLSWPGCSLFSVCFLLFPFFLLTHLQSTGPVIQCITVFNGVENVYSWAGKGNIVCPILLKIKINLNLKIAQKMFLQN